MNDKDAYHLLIKGKHLLESGHNHQAAIVLEQARDLEPQKGSIREALARALYNSGQTSRANEEFERAVELDPTDDYAHYALGRALEKQGRDAEANGHYKLASSLRPGDEGYADRIMDLEPPDEAA